MANNTVIISKNNNGNLQVSVDPVEVDPGDTVTWQLDSGSNLKWPHISDASKAIWKNPAVTNNPTVIISYAFVNNTIVGTVDSNAVRGSEEDYVFAATPSTPPPSGNPEIEVMDPKIKVKTITPF